MRFRYMRILLFYDLPTLSSANLKAYRDFVKDIIKIGFYRIQESVFVKMAINPQSVDSVYQKLEQIKPKEGNIFCITVTEQQFSKMKFILGEIETDVISSTDRIIEL